MKTVLIALATICFLLGEVHSEDKYTTKYDDVDINAVLNSERLLNGYVSCLLDRGACTPDALELKNCAKSKFMQIYIPFRIQSKNKFSVEDCFTCRTLQIFHDQRIAFEIAENLPDALEHNCSACSEKQKEIADKISHYLIDHKAEEWSLLEANDVIPTSSKEKESDELLYTVRSLVMVREPVASAAVDSNV
ncbi:Ejaculatory bulb-specific protein 3 [Melipona quadrifasciata]|uniref:Ejaculatory bulb-specific protein 3 n=1 Tax=Melipona quadrifasciata TaxID=166423 RepID=A0A0M9A4W0_9HYME|nr:Ejaculatory bulb-specific protein 3 [Melipona quadrifasciata]